MAGTQIEFDWDDSTVQSFFQRMRERMQDASPAMRVVASIMRTSVVRNFEKQGRPRWEPLSPVTLALRKRKKKGRKRKSKGSARKPKILRVQGFAGGLLGSISGEATANSAMVGTNKIYAAVHQFGAKKGEFGTVTITRKIATSKRSGGSRIAKPYQMQVPWGDIPARPFLVLQDEDKEEIRKTLNNFILRGDVE
jgi:phage virion morphogenesis protein